MILEYKGFLISQEEKCKHIMISKDGHLMFHANMSKNAPIYTEEMLKEYVDAYLDFVSNKEF